MTTATTQTLSDFLLARIAEDEKVARAAIEGPWGWDGWTDGHAAVRVGPYDVAELHGSYVAPPEVGVDGLLLDGDLSADDEARWKEWRYSAAVADATHIARHDPARVLAECEASRAIVAMHRPINDSTAYASLLGVACVLCTKVHADMDCEGEDWPCRTLRHLAAPYSDHPDFDPSWRV